MTHTFTYTTRINGTYIREINDGNLIIRWPPYLLHFSGEIQLQQKSRIVGATISIPVAFPWLCQWHSHVAMSVAFPWLCHWHTRGYVTGIPVAMSLAYTWLCHWHSRGYVTYTHVYLHIHRNKENTGFIARYK